MTQSLDLAHIAIKFTTQPVNHVSHVLSFTTQLLNHANLALSFTIKNLGYAKIVLRSTTWIPNFAKLVHTLNYSILRLKNVNFALLPWLIMNHPKPVPRVLTLIILIPRLAFVFSTAPLFKILTRTLQITSALASIHIHTFPI